MLATACGDPGDAASVSTTVSEAEVCAAEGAPPARLLSVRSSPGYPFASHRYEFVVVPHAVLYDDGTLLTESEDAPFGLRRTELACDEMVALVVAADRAGLRPDPPDVGNARLQRELADANTTTFELHRGDDVHAITVYGLGTDASSSARDRLKALRDDLLDRGRGGEPYEPVTVSVWVEDFETSDLEGLEETDGEPETREWPLGDLAAGVDASVDRTFGWCAGIAADDLPDVANLAGGRVSPVRWRSGDGTYRLSFRADLPDRDRCEEEEEEEE